MNMKKTLGLVTIIILIFASAAVIYRLIQTDVSPANIQTLSPNEARNEASNAPADNNLVPTDNQTISTERTQTTEGTQETRANYGNQVGDLAYDFTLQDHDGNEVTLSDYRGQTVVINFWIFGCPACYNEFPDFQRLYDQIDEESIEDVKMIKIYIGPIGSSPTLDEMREMLDDNGYSFPTYWDTGAVAMNYGTYYMPHTFVIDEDGIISASAVGAISYESLIGLVGLEDNS